MRIYSIAMLVVIILPLILGGCHRGVQFDIPADDIMDEIVDQFPLYTIDYDDFLLLQGTIFLYGEINTWKAEKFHKEIIHVQQSGRADRIRVYLSSHGGDAIAMEIICQAIKTCPKEVDIYVNGLCMSSACKVLQSATGKRLATSTAIFGLHSFSGTKKVRDIIQANYVEILRKRACLPESLFPLTRELKVLNAQEALDYCFIDEIVE